MMTVAAIRCLAAAFTVALASSMPAFGQAQTRSVAVMSDIHFDPFGPPELVRRLAAADTDDWGSLFTDAADQRLSTYGEDTNHVLLKSSLAAFARAAADADFAIIPGDLLSHNFEKQAGMALGVPEISPATDAFAVRTTIFVADAIEDALPGKPIILALGNNDSGCGDYRIEPGGDYLAATRETVRRLAGAARVEADFDETYAAGGYYAVRHPTVAKTLILVVNDALWSTRYQNACGTNGLAGADAMMSWLRERLARAKAAGEHVWMVHHIPWGISSYSTLHSNAEACSAKIAPFLKEPYASAFVSLLLEHSDIVRASFSGHIHYDDYRLLLDEKGSAIGLDKVVPAISPIFGQNPGFQIFAYDKESGAPTDFSTFYLANLDKAENPAAADWRLEYAFTQAYTQPRYSLDAVEAVWQAISEGGPLADTFRKLYPVSRGDLRQDILPAYACAIGHVDPQSYSVCFCGD